MSGAPVRIEAVGGAAADALAALHAAAFPEAWGPVEITALLARPGAFALVARAGRRAEPAGFILCAPAGDDYEVMTLAVAPPWQGRGVGGRLLAAAVERAAATGARRLLLEVAEDNRAALRLYRRHGFAEVGRRPGYHRDGDGRPRAALVLGRVFTAAGPEA